MMPTKFQKSCRTRDAKPIREKRPFAYFYNRFPRYKEIQRYLRTLSERFKNFAKVETIGKSYEGRDIDMIVVSKFKSNKKKNAVFIDANIHAREWLSNSTILYFIDYIVRKRSILNLMDFYIVPCLNPDGYEYTHTQHRLWRKNRNPNKSCRREMQGVDLNRNFPFGYGLRGSSGDPGSFMYRGEFPLSEPEARALANALEKYRGRIKLYISFHCYGNVILFPWGFTAEPVEDRCDLVNEKLAEECGYAFKDAMAKCCKDRKFKVGSTASKMYLSSGGSADYAKGIQDIKFSYTIELQRYGKSGFTPSPNRILEIGEETTIGILAMVKYVYKYYSSKESRKDSECRCCESRKFN